MPIMAQQNVVYCLVDCTYYVCHVYKIHPFS